MFLKRWFGGADGRELTPELLAKIRESFDHAASDDEHFPSTIDPRIWHVRWILDELRPLAPKRILDVGCGKGRFARLAAAEFPDAEVWGLDLSEAMLRFVPEPVKTRAGSMTELPFADGEFDAAYATESLEHAVEIEKAVSEICRVVRPGGKVLIIDKNRDHKGRLETPEWERWFGRGELEKLLRKHCGEASSRYISYWEDVQPDGLFIAWSAQR